MDANRFRAWPASGPRPAPPGGRGWESFMNLALDLARAASAREETPVGAVILDPHGEILAAAGNEVEARNDPCAHAEILAIRAACQRVGNYRLNGCVLAVTLEPCLMCAGAIIHARLAGLVYGAADTRAGAIASCLDFQDLPGAAGIWHMGGVLSGPCARLLREFFERFRA